MMPNPAHRLPPPIESAVHSLKLCARAAVERSVESLGLAALAAASLAQRDALLAAQFELNRKSAVFILNFNEAFDQRILREVGGVDAADAAPTRWDALSLVEDREVELQILAERFGMDIALACEWELRELNAFVGSLLHYRGSDKDRNPLRPELVGQAMVRAVEAVSERADLRELLSSELSRSLGSMLRATYADIVADMRRAGVEPMGLSLRSAASRSSGQGAGDADADAVQRKQADQRRADASRTAPNPAASGERAHGRPGRTEADRTRAGSRSDAPGRSGGSDGTPMGEVDAGLMSLIRRLALGAPGVTTVNAGGSGDTGADVDLGPLPNLIRAHRDELRQASSGSLDHRVIDLIGGLFDQIMVDPKVAPQMVRQIARLQLPVLRAALGDPGFFSSRHHPVRRFVNRIASLGAAVDDFGDAAGQGFLAKVRELVQEVVEGDFGQVDIYEQKLVALEQFIAEQAARELAEHGDAAELLSQKEDEQRLHQLYALRLQGELKPLAGPEFVRDFISQVWSQALLRAAETGGADSAQARRLREVGRELFMSVQPKATAALRKAFLAGLPKLMLELTEGMNLVGWPESQRRVFFGQLMPAHAQALRSQGTSQLDINLLARQVEAALAKPLPLRGELGSVVAGLPVLVDEIIPARFTPAQAQRIGLVDEAAVDWSRPVESAPGADAAAAAVAPLPGLSAPDDRAEPMQGSKLADHVQIGNAYQMHLQDSWRKVRLTHVSAARSFFVFSHGRRHSQTISLTRRMLQRLCETGRLRAFEEADLIARATARAQRQTAARQPEAGKLVPG